MLPGIRSWRCPGWCAVFLALTLSGCGLFETKPPVTEIVIAPAPQNASLDVITIASPLVNPSPSGEPSPIVLRLYQLSAETAFVNASFRDLWENDEATLGPTLLGKVEIYLEPGGVERIKANLIEGTTIVAFVAGFRQFDKAKWRAMLPMQGESQFKMKADLKTLSIDLGPQ